MPSVKSLSYAVILILANAAALAASVAKPPTSNLPAVSICPSHDNLTNLKLPKCMLVGSDGKVIERNLTYQSCGKERLRLGKPLQSFHNPAPALATCRPQ